MTSKSHAGRPAPLVGLTCLAAALAGSACGIGREARVVAVISQTGANAPYGVDISRGMQLAMAEANAEGEEDRGKRPQVTLEIVDDGSDSERAVQLMEEAIAGKAFAILGPIEDDAFFAVGPLAEESGTTVLSPWTSTALAQRGLRNLFRNYPSDEVQTARLARLMRREMDPRVKDLALLTVLTDRGRGLKAAFGAQFKRLQGRVETSKHFAPGLTEAQATELVGGLRDRPADGCLVVAAGADLVQVLRALEAIEYRGRVFTTAALHHPALIEEAGSAAEGVLFAAPIREPEGNAVAKAFGTAYRAAHGEPPSMWAALGYDAAWALARGIAVDGSYSDALASNLYSLNFTSSGAMGEIAFDSTTGECADCRVRIQEVRDGAVLVWEAAAGAGRR